MLYSLVLALWGEGKTGPTPSGTRGNFKNRVCGRFFRQFHLSLTFFLFIFLYPVPGV